MGRLNQSRRQKIGYSYCPQVINDVAIQPKMRNMAMVQEQAFDQNMRGEGIKEIIRGILDNRKRILEMGSKAVDIATSEAGKQAGKIVFDALPSSKQEQIKSLSDTPKPIQTAIQRRQDIADMVKTGSKLVKDIRGNGLNPAGGSRGSIHTGGGLSPAGGAIDIRGNQEGDVLPGDALKKKLLQKMVRDRRMKSLGDRTKTTPLQAGFNGGSLVIPTNNNKMGSQSKSKTLFSYKLNPRPLVGAGKIPKKNIISHLQKSLIPVLKSEGLITKELSNTDKIKKLIAIRINKIIKQGVLEPQKIITKVVESLKPIMNKDISGSGFGTIINKAIAKLMAGMFRIGNPDSVIAKGFDKLGSGRENLNHKGGFIFSAIAAAIAAIASAASAAAATTVVGGVTVGALAGTALTGAAGAAGAAIVNKIAGNGISKLKDEIVKVAKETKITYNDFSQQDKEKIKSEFNKLKQNKSKEGVIAFSKSIAPIVIKETKKKLKPEMTKVFKKVGLSGSGLKLAGQGLGLAGKGEKKFKNEFVKNMVNLLA